MKRILNLALIAALCFGPAVVWASNGGAGGNNGANGSGGAGQSGNAGGPAGQGQGGGGSNGGVGGSPGNAGGGVSHGGGGDTGGGGRTGGGTAGGGSTAGAGVSVGAGSGAGSGPDGATGVGVYGGQTAFTKTDRDHLIAVVRMCEMTRPGLAIGDTRANGAWSFVTFDDTVWPFVQRCMADHGYPANGPDYHDTTNFGQR